MKDNEEDTMNKTQGDTSSDQPPQPSGNPTATALEATMHLPPMAGRLDGDHFWPDRFFVEPSLAAVIASWRARGWMIETVVGKPRSWGIQAMKGDELYEQWAAYGWNTWGDALDQCEADPGGSIGRSAYDATKPTPERTWLVGCHVW